MGEPVLGKMGWQEWEGRNGGGSIRGYMGGRNRDAGMGEPVLGGIRVAGMGKAGMGEPVLGGIREVGMGRQTWEAVLGEMGWQEWGRQEWERQEWGASIREMGGEMEGGLTENENSPI